MRPLLLTRPYDDSLEMQKTLANGGFASLVAPMLEISPMLEAQITVERILSEQTIDAIVATSRHAFASLSMATSWQTLPLYCVGAQTAEAAKCHGWKGFAHLYDDSAALIKELLSSSNSQRLLYLRGKHISAELSTAAARHLWQEIITYDAVACPGLPKETIAAFRQNNISGVILCSRRSANLFEQSFSQASLHRAQFDAFCLSEQIASSLKLDCWQERIWPNRPTIKELMALIERILKQAA